MQCVSESNRNVVSFEIGALTSLLIFYCTHQNIGAIYKISIN